MESLKSKKFDVMDANAMKAIRGGDDRFIKTDPGVYQGQKVLADEEYPSLKKTHLHLEDGTDVWVDVR